MLTNKITGFSVDLLNTVRGVLDEAKHNKDCECEKCEAEEAKEGYMPTADEPTDANKKTADKVRAMMAKEKKPVKEGYASAAQRKAVWANRADDGAGHPDKKKKLKEEILEMVNEASDGLADKAKKSGISLSTLKKVYARGIAAWNSGHRPGTTPQQWAHARVNSYITKGKGTYHGADKDLRSEGTDVPFEGPYRKTGEERKDQYGNKVKNVAKYLAKKAMKANEEVEHNNCGTCDTPTQIDELSKPTMGRYINKAKDSIDMASYRQGHKEAHGSSSKSLEKKLTKRHKGISTAVSKLTKEDSEQIDETAKIVAHLQKRYGDNIRKSHVRSAANDFGVDASKLAKAVRTKLGKNMLDEEQIDELSKGTMGRYINKAATKMGSQGVTAGLKIAADEKSSKNFKDMGKREKGIKLAVSKLTKEEQDFIDSLNDADMEQIDELSKDTMLKYLSANKKSGARGGRDTIKRMRGADMAVRKYTARDTKYVRVPATEEVELEEARGRPRKAGAKDFTIHPKTKEKLMHNNPEHMKKIEALQKNKILDKPKVEASQHIMNQLSKAKTSMLGGSTIHFTHGDSKHVSGTHAAKLLTKYAGMKPSEKEGFQKKIGHSHEQLMKHV